MNEAELDRLLADTLTPNVRMPDRAFANSVDMAVAEHQRYARERKRLWVRTATDLAAALSVVGGLLVLSRAEMLAPYAGSGLLSLSSPLALVLLLWVGVQRWRLA